MVSKKGAIAVRGSGIVSHVCAIMIARLGYKVIHIKRGDPLNNDSFFAITPSIIDWLRRLGLPQDFFQNIHALKKINLINAQANIEHLFNADEMFLDSLAFMVKQTDFIDALSSKDSANIFNMDLDQTSYKENSNYVECSSGSESIKASLLIVCDADDKEIINDGFGETVKQYNQTAITFSFYAKEGNFDCASQFFFEDSILALLPLSHSQVGVVWSCNNVLRDLLVHLNPENFKSFFEKRIKKKFTVDSELNAKNQFNLKLKTLDSVFDKRVLAIGDAAHIIHPMAGQGLNLGLRDIRAIEALLESSKIEDAGNENFLRRYEKMRKKDVAQLALLTDVLSNTVHGEHYVNKLNKGSIIPAAINGLLKNKFLKQAIIKQATQ